MLSGEKMSEAEVSLRLAFHLISHDFVTSSVVVAIDGAQIKTLETYHFNLTEFLEQNGCVRDELGTGWAGTYSFCYPRSIVIHSYPGRGDVEVVWVLRTGNRDL